MGRMLATLRPAHEDHPPWVRTGRRYPVALRDQCDNSGRHSLPAWLAARPQARHFRASIAAPYRYAATSLPGEDNPNPTCNGRAPPEYPHDSASSQATESCCLVRNSPTGPLAIRAARLNLLENELRCECGPGRPNPPRRAAMKRLDRGQRAAHDSCTDTHMPLNSGHILQ